MSKFAFIPEEMAVGGEWILAPADFPGFLCFDTIGLAITLDFRAVITSRRFELWEVETLRLNEQYAPVSYFAESIRPVRKVSYTEPDIALLLASAERLVEVIADGFVPSAAAKFIAECAKAYTELGKGGLILTTWNWAIRVAAASNKQKENASTVDASLN